MPTPACPDRGVVSPRRPVVPRPRRRATCRVPLGRLSTSQATELVYLAHATAVGAAVVSRIARSRAHLSTAATRPAHQQAARRNRAPAAK